MSLEQTRRTSCSVVLPTWAAAWATAWLLGAVVAAPAFASTDGRPAVPSLPTRVDALFVIDNSGSMRQSDPYRATHRVVTDFAAGLPRGARLGIVLFDETARLIEPLTRAGGPSSIERLRAVLGQVDYGGQLTNSPAGVERALYELKHNGRDDAQKVIVFITDGIVDTGDRIRDREKSRWLTGGLAEEARRSGVRVFGIAFTDAADVELIQQLSATTGGEYWRVREAGEIAGVVGDVARRMRQPAPARVAVSGGEGGFSIDDLRQRLAPVSSAPPDRTRGLVLLSLGLAVAALVLFYPAFERRRRRIRERPVAFAPGAPPQAAGGYGALPALPRAGRPPVVKLVDVSVAADGKDVVLLLEKPTTRIGRDDTNEVVVRSETVSSFHATIDYRDGYFYLEDHRSTNGTSLNGHRLASSQPIQLKSGDRIDVAEHEFRFLIPDHEPRGRTAGLPGTSVPLAAIEHEDAAEAPSGGADDAPARFASAFDKCLGVHLDKIARLGEPHERFIERAYPADLRGQLAHRAHQLIERSLGSEQPERADLSRSGVHYTLCVVPDSMEGAREWYTAEHGGYAKFLVGLLDAWATSGRDCDAVCVVTFGMVENAWVSVTIVPARESGEIVEVMSFEFLSEDDRRKALSLDVTDVMPGTGAG